MREVGKQFEIDSDSTVSSVMARMKNRLAKDRLYAGRLEELIKAIKVGQERI